MGLFTLSAERVRIAHSVMRKLLPFLAASGLFAAANPPGNGYLLHNLVSDQFGVADFVDKNLVNAWGIDASATGPFWVGDGGTGLSTVYSGNGAVSATLAIVPGAAKSTSTSVATGLIFNGTGGFRSRPGGLRISSCARGTGRFRAGIGGRCDACAVDGGQFDE
jgi:hypothetical protein